MLKQLLLLSLILIGMQSACSPGCSKCVKEDSEDKCEICDLSRFYYLQEDGTCELKTHPNCKIASPSFTSKLCVQCHDNHFFDELVQACVSVPDSKKDENCSVYSLVADCLRCNQGYIVESGKCVTPSNVISNCLWQVSEEHCQTCKSGFQLNVARTTCIEFSTVNNCQYHQSFYCNRCKSDYTLALNWDLLSRMTLSNLQESLSGDLSLAVTLDSAKEDCVLKDISNCVEYDSYGRCKTCDQAYHVDPSSGKCSLSREPEIFKCKVYTNVTTCAECNFGFYLSSNKCLERNLIEHCLEYTVDSNSCDECAQGYYSADSSCQLRNASANINHCQVYKKKEDKCETCEDPFVLSTDFIKCFQPIKHCEVTVNALSTEVLSCTTCKPETVPQVDANSLTIACNLRDNGGCVTWNADNSNECSGCLTNYFWLHPNTKLCNAYTKKCKTYALDADNCATCYADQYLKNADPLNISCINYTVKNCDNFEANVDQCTDCVAGYYKDSTKNECHPYTLVNCSNPSPNENKCLGCDINFYLADSLTCLPEDLLECQVKANNICTTCNLGFKLVDGKCYPGTQNGCLAANYQTNLDKCNTCESGFYKTTAGDCIAYTVKNCQGSTNDGYAVDKDECTDCLPGFYLDANKKCQILKVPNCNKSTNDTGTPCTECAVGFYPDGDACLAQYVAFCQDYTAELNECTTCKPGYYRQSATSCTKIEIPNCATHTSNANTCDTCDSGFETNAAKTECLKTDEPGCQTYVNGICTVARTNFYIELGKAKPRTQAYCLVSTDANGGCTTCVDGYKRTDSGGGIFVCQKPSINDCETIGDNGNCLICKNGYYTDDSGVSCTILTAKTNCAEYSKTADECTLCLDGTVLDGSGGCTATAVVKKTLNCKGTTAILNSNENCTTCPSGALKIGLTGGFYKKNDYGIYSHTEAGAIKQFAEGFEYNSSEVQVAKDDTLCLQLKENLSGTDHLLSSNTNCSKCRDYNTHYLESEICKPRTTAPLCGVFSKTSDACVACQPGLAYNAVANANNTCTELLISTTTNCKYTNFGAPNCYMCDPTFVVDTAASNVCVSNAMKNCRTFANTDATVCTECYEGFYWDPVVKTCRKPETCFTGEYHDNSTFCSHCMPGFKPVTGNKYYCEPALAEDICSLYSNSALNDTLSYCVQCKEIGTVPLNEVNGSTVTFRCIKSLYPFQKNVGIIQNSSTYTYHPSYPATGFGYSKVTTYEVAGVANPSHICQSMDVPHCKTYNFATSVIAPCSECDIGYYLEPNTKNGQSCLKGGIAGCKTYATKNSCSLCESKWALDQTNTAEKFCKPYDNIPFCEVHSGTSAACLKCASGYLLRNSECFMENHANCKHFDFVLDNCFGCESGFFLKDGICRAYTQTNCLEFDQTEDYCTVCAEDFYVYEGVCNYNTSLNCQMKSKLQNNCLDCQDGHYMDLTTSLCHPFITPNCLIFDRESPSCLNCQPEFYLKNGFCNPYSVQNCMIRDSEMDRCELCEEGFFLNSLGFCEQYSLNNCAVYNPNANLCHQCNAGFYLVESRVCEVHTVRNCSVFNDFSNQCLSCLPGHFKNSANDCVKYTNTKNCDLVDPSMDACVTCKVGYYMDFGVCQQYTVRNCSLYKPDANLCVTCQRGYFLLQNTCEPYSVRCEQYNPLSNTCVTCPEGYYLDGGLCYVNNGLFCKEMSPFRNGCKSCLEDFYLKDGQCKIRMNSTNCKEVVETGDICLSCFETHYLAAGFCISYARDTCKTFNEKKDLCTECETGKYWMSHHICEEYTVENCEVFSPTSDKCTQCKIGKYYLDSTNGVCLESTEVEMCKQYSHTVDACTHCDDGFYLVSGSECRRNPTGLFKCIQYKDENTCIKCETGFYVDNNYCQKSKVTIEHCISYFAEGKCNECASTHFILENVCLEKTETSCLTWKDSNNCLTCQPNFFLKTNENSNEVCVDSELAHCVKAEEGSPENKCLQCGDKKLLVNDTCQDPVSPLTGCKVYVEEGECSECDDGFTLTKSKNGCVSNHSFMSDNCAFSIEKSNPVCRSCMSGYHLDDNRECVSCGGNGCNVCNPYDSTKCLFCQPGFNHNGDSCTQEVVADSGLTTNRIYNSVSVLKEIMLLFFAFSMIVIR